MREFKRQNAFAKFTRPVLESLEGRQLMSTDHPLGVSLNGGALGSAHYSETKQQIQALGIDSVRIFLSVPAGATSPGQDQTGFMEHLFDLYRDLGPGSSYASHKLNILLTITPSNNTAPDTGTNLQSYLTGLLNYQDSGGTLKVKDIVDRYEIGNEINSQSFYNYNSNDGSATSTARVDSYISNFLVPAANKLSELDPTAELSAGSILAYSGDTGNMLGYLLSKTPASTMSKLKYVGYHPYGIDATTPLSSGSGGVLALDGLARQQVSDYNASHPSNPVAIISTEWGTNSPSYASGWAERLNQSFTGSTASGTSAKSAYVANSVRDTYATAYYYPFGLDSETSGQPHGGQALLNLQGSTETPFSDFYNMYAGWSSSSFTGQVTDGSGNALGSRTVYIDVNNNNVLDANEPSGVSAANGNYTISYSVGGGSNTFVQGGDYTLRIASSSTSASVHVAPASSQTVNLGATTPPPSTATISGTYFGDSNGNGVKDGTETGQSGKTMYIDADDDGVLDSGETTAITDASGSYTFTVPVSGANTTFIIRRDGLPAGYRLTAPNAQGRAVVTVAPGGSSTGNDFGTTSLVLIQGTVTNDTTNAGVAGQTVYVDTNNDGTPDATATTDSNGAYSLGSLAAGTYTVRLTPTSNYTQSFPAGNGGVTVTPSNPNAATANFTVHSVSSSNGTLSGVYWGDGNGNGVKDTGELPQSGKIMYLDANNNGVLDSGELTSTTDANGAYSFTNLAVGQTYRVRRSGLPSGFRFTTPVAGYYDVALTAANPTATDRDFLVTDKASITGTYFGDSNANGVFDPGETGQSGKVMYLDTNNNGVLDSGELTSTTDANGLYRFDGLAVNSGNTYHIRRSGLPAGFRLTTPATGVIDLVLTDVKSYDGNDFGVTYA